MYNTLKLVRSERPYKVANGGGIWKISSQERTIKENF